jgi:glutamine synthetase
MSCFAQRCGRHDAAAIEQVLGLVKEHRLGRVRVAWCDLHGQWRGKTLMPCALRAAFDEGVGMVSTLLLKDTADRTAVDVFGAEAPLGLAGLRAANNVLLLPDPASFRVLPWAEGTGWLQAQPWFDDASAVPIDPRRALQTALQALAEAGFGLRCGLEVEFHIYRILDPQTDPQLDPVQATWPVEPPAVALVHPGHQLLGEAWADLADEPLAIVQRTAQGLGLPLRSLEVELGPSQVEAVFDATDALTAADQMVLFRNGVRQALRRAGYHASFVCRPPFANAIASGWHLHQSLVHLDGGRNAFVRGAPAGGAGDAREVLSDSGAAWLAGLLAHGRGAALCATPTINGYTRYQGSVMAPAAVDWGRDHRGAMLRVIGGPGDAATRIENRSGEPMACPYLYIAAQVHAGLDGLRCGLVPPPAAAAAERLPVSLGEALDAFAADKALVQGLGVPLAQAYGAIKRAELRRHDEAGDSGAWQRREYFGRY